MPRNTRRPAIGSRSLIVVFFSSCLVFLWGSFGDTSMFGGGALAQPITASGKYRAFVNHFPVTQPAYHAKLLPSFLDRFDWVISQPSPHGTLFPGHRRCRDPKTVFAVPSALHKLLRIASEDFDRERRDRIVVFAASDDPLSRVLGPNHTTRVATTALLRKFFNLIFYEAADISVNGIRVMPIGLAEFYLSRGVANNASTAIASASLDRKPSMALAAWNAYWALDSPSRLLADRFAKSIAAHRAGVEFGVVHRRAWWAKLAKYRFLLIPLGSRIQCVKMIEALLVLTIPIVHRGWYKWGKDDHGAALVVQMETSLQDADGSYSTHDELIALGFPIIVVNHWADVTSRNLTRWWSESSPRLMSFRRNCLTAEGYWRMVTGRVARCE